MFIRRFMSSVTCFALFAGAFGFSALAAEKKDPPKKDPPAKTSPEETKFKKLDKDKNGKLSKKEIFGERVAGFAESAFEKSDKDKDGSLSLEEYKEFQALVKKGDK